MRTLAITLFLILSSVIYTAGQSTYQLAETLDFFRSNKMQSGDWKQTLTEDDIKGSPYLNDEFITGTIYTTSKMRYENVPLRYNIYNDNLEFKTPDNGVKALATPEIVEKVAIGENQMEYIPYITLKKMKRGFFVVKESGRTTLYARPQVLYKKPTEPGAYKDAEPATFIKKPDEYYLRFGKEAAIKIGNKKELISAFPDHQKEIAAFVKKNKTKPGKEESLIKLVQYYNSL